MDWGVGWSGFGLGLGLGQVWVGLGWRKVGRALVKVWQGVELWKGWIWERLGKD